MKALPTYDCGGEIIIRFQRTLSTIDVRYAHAAIHRKVASRRTQTQTLSWMSEQLLPGPIQPSVTNEAQVYVSPYSHHTLKDPPPPLLEESQRKVANCQSANVDGLTRKGNGILLDQATRVDSALSVPVSPDLAARIELLRTPNNDPGSLFGVFPTNVQGSLFGVLKPSYRPQIKPVKSRLSDSNGTPPISVISSRVEAQKPLMDAQHSGRHPLFNVASPDISTNPRYVSSDRVHSPSTRLQQSGQDQQYCSQLPPTAEKRPLMYPCSGSTSEYTSNGTPLQEGVFEHHPNCSRSENSVKTRKI